MVSTHHAWITNRAYSRLTHVYSPGPAERLISKCDRVGPDVTQVPVELLAMNESAQDAEN